MGRDMPALVERFPTAARLLERGIADGAHVGAQLYVSRAGHVLADDAIGLAREGRPLRADDLMLWMSAGKPVMGVAILQLRERGLLELEDPVSRYLPEFAAHGKQAVTLCHVLTHTGGFRGADPKWSSDPWEEILAEICAADPDPDAVPGAQSAYHVSAGWYVLAELVRRVDGRDYGSYAREEVLAPLGSRDVWFGMPEAAHRGYGERIVSMHYQDHGRPVPFEAGPFSGSVSGCAIARPGGSAWGPIRELGWLYESLLAGGVHEGGRILSGESVALMRARHTERMHDASFGVVLDRGLGVVVDSRHHDGGGNWFGQRCSRDSFGHGGFGSSVAFADPDRELAIALVFNGFLEHSAHEARMREVVDAIYDDLDKGAA